MQRVLHQPEGRPAQGLERVPQRHGAKAPVRLRERETQQIGPGRVTRGLSGQAVAATSQEVVHSLANGADPGGNLHRDHGGQQVRLPFRRRGKDTAITPDLDVACEEVPRTGQQHNADDKSDGTEADPPLVWFVCHLGTVSWGREAPSTPPQDAC